MLFRQIVVCSFFANVLFSDMLTAKEILPRNNKILLASKESTENQFLYFDNNHSKADHSIIRNLNISANLSQTRHREKQSGHINTLIPLAYDKNRHNHFFFIPGVTLNRGCQTYNAGLGFRHLNNTKDILFGFNTFYDYGVRHSNKRMSQGVELAVQNVSLSGNIYHELNKWQTSKHNERLQRKVSPGYDAKLKVDMPFYPQVGVSVRYFHWKGHQVDLYGSKRHFNSPHGFTYGAEYKPTSMLSIGIQHTLKHRYRNTAVTLNIAYDFSRSLQSQMKFHWHPHSRPLPSKLFNHIEREGNIILKTRMLPAPRPLDFDPFDSPLPSPVSDPGVPLPSPLSGSGQDTPPTSPLPNQDTPPTSPQGSGGYDENSNDDSSSDTDSVSSAGNLARYINRNMGRQYVSGNGGQNNEGQNNSTSTGNWNISELPIPLFSGTLNREISWQNNPSCLPQQRSAPLQRSASDGELGNYQVSLPSGGTHNRRGSVNSDVYRTAVPNLTSAAAGTPNENNAGANRGTSPVRSFHSAENSSGSEFEVELESIASDEGGSNSSGSYVRIANHDPDSLSDIELDD